MGSASREALDVARQVLNGLIDQSVTGFGGELLQASAVLNRNPKLLATLADPSAAAERKEQVVRSVFASAQEPTRTILTAAVSQKWSHPVGLVEGIEELGIRAEAHGTDNLDQELLAIDNVIGQNHELELTLGSKLGGAEAKAQAVTKIFGGKVSENALFITRHIVSNPRGRRVGRVLQDLAKIIADQEGAELATVTLAAPIDNSQLQRLEALLTKSAGRPVKLSIVIDPDLVGGVRIQIADEVIDGSVRARLDDLRLQLAG